MQNKSKISSTAYKVLILMKLLNEENLNLQEISQFFSNQKDVSTPLSKEVILKYLNTLKASGYKISKPSFSNDYRYELLKAPYLINLSKDDLITIVKLEYFIENLFLKELDNSLKNILNKMDKFLPEETVDDYKRIKKSLCGNNTFDLNIFDYSEYAEMIHKFEVYCVEAQRIQITFKIPYEESKKTITLEPKELNYKEDKVFISGYNPLNNENQDINLQYITDTKQLPTKSKNTRSSSPVIFKLKGRLATTYSPYEGEKIYNDQDDYIKVYTYTEEKNNLLKRLLKYGDDCEILYPAEIREKIKETIFKTLNNYKQIGEINSKTF